jgi:acetyl esterase/lipase
MAKNCSFFTLLLAMTLICPAQFKICLYESKIPGSRPPVEEENRIISSDNDTIVSKVSKPELTVYLPPAGNAARSAVIICPGGGYQVLVMLREGHRIAKAFIDHGIAAFVLKYRLPDDNIMTDKSIGPLQDAQKAILTVREHAGEWNIDPFKIGIMGFSAGGHLASTAATHFDRSFIDNKNNTSLRPDFMILIYPVISLTDSLMHRGSRTNLLGNIPDKEKIMFFSGQYNVTSETPPAFMTHAGDDVSVPVGNSLEFYNALRNYSIPAGLFIYSSGGHGYIKTPPFEEWFGRCIFWMRSNGWL